MSTPPDADNVTPKQQTPPDANDLTPKPQASPDAAKKMHASYFFIAVCIVVMLAIVGFSMYYISNLGQDILLQFEAIAETLPLPSTPTDQPINQTITVEVNRSTLLSADYLAVVLPILFTLAGAFIVFLGMNRLKMYDERIDSVRSSLLHDLDTMVKNQVAANQAELNEKVISELINQRTKFNEEVSNAASLLSQQAEDHAEAIRKAGEPFAWLREAASRDEFDLNVTTVDDAHKLVEILRKEKPKNYIELIQNIVAKVSDDNLSGDSADYHNLSAELERGSMYQESLKVLEKGITQFPTNTTLLADKLDNLATAGSGSSEDAKKTYEDLERLKDRWTWHCYIFSSNYFRSIGDLEKALKLCDDCIQNLPLQQQGYQKKAELVQMMTPGTEGINMSIEVLKSIVDKGYSCPQCANALGELYLDLGLYDEALDVFDQAVMYLAQPQPGINTSYVFFHRANCHDRMFLKDTSDRTHLNQAILDYQTAIAFKGLTEITITSASQRLALLNLYSPDIT